MKAIILCAGRGERMMPLTLNTPKPLLLISQKPILSYIFKSLPDEISEVFLVVQEKFEKIFENFVKDINSEKKITILLQDKGEEGTYYALMAGRPFLEDQDKFLVLNGDDIFFKKDLESLLKEKTPCYGISLKKIQERYYTCDLDFKNKKIISFRKQKAEEFNKEVPCFSGAFTLNGDFFSYKPVFYNEKEAGIPHTLFHNTNRVFFFLIEDWLQINNPSDLNQHSNLLN